MEKYNLKDATKYGNRDAEQQNHSYSTMMLYEVADMIDDAPTIEAVPLDGAYIKQIRWERDIALEQLADIGCELGRDMTDIKEKLEAVPVHGEWLHHERPNSIWAICSACNHPLGAFSYKFCPMCGADMRKKV